MARTGGGLAVTGASRALLGSVSCTGPWALARDRRIHPGQVTRGPESPVDTDRESASLEQRQAREHARDRPAGDRDQLVDGVQSEHQLTPEPARRVADIGQRRRRLRA